jgi:hypothetical protein
MQVSNTSNDRSRHAHTAPSLERSATSEDSCGLSDEELLRSLTTLVATGRQVLAQLLVYLAEVEERRIHLAMACSSMFDFARRSWA